MPDRTDTADWSHHDVFVNGVRVHYVEAGGAARGGETVILLHGFPEFWYGWRNQIGPLAAARFRVVAPDLRGYNLSSKPSRVLDYRVETLADDVAALITTLGARPAHVVGHDWGGIVAWFVAMRHRNAVAKLAVLNAPHPAAYLRELRRGDQLLRSWYALFFQLPWLPEAAIRFNDFAAVRRLFRHDPRRPFAEHEIDRYIEALARPGALRAALNYYRAAFRRRPRELRYQVRTIRRPTLLIWGERDRYLVPGLTRGLEAWVPNLRVERLPHATHWPHHDEPGRVNQLLESFLFEG